MEGEEFYDKIYDLKVVFYRSNPLFLTHDNNVEDIKTQVIELTCLHIGIQISEFYFKL